MSLWLERAVASPSQLFFTICQPVLHYPYNESMARHFVSTSIPYINAEPHIGFVWEAILADCFSRYQRSRGHEVFSLSGTDENGLKIYRAAETRGLPIQAFADEVAGKFSVLQKDFNLSWGNFIRTSSAEHARGVHAFWQRCRADIYQGEYEGLYCVGCEDYYKPEEVPDNICPLHQKPLEVLREKNYFFKLTKYLPQVRELIASDKIKIVPEKRKHATLAMIDAGTIGDLSISRSATRSGGWGIAVPGDKSQTIYVWFDALVNYLTGLGFGSDDQTKLEAFWQKADQVTHFVGKDIFKFHAIYWPAMLLSAGLRLPDTIFVHDFIMVEGSKMSKTIGNVVTPADLLTKYRRDTIRYYLLSQGSQFDDFNFTWSALEQIVEGELKHEIGNLASRVFGLLKHAPETIPLDQNLLTAECAATETTYCRSFEAGEFHHGLRAVYDLVKITNQFIEQHKLWQGPAPDGAGQGVTVAHYATLIHVLSYLARWYAPVMPEAAAKLIVALDLSEGATNFQNRQTPLAPLF